MPYKVSHINPAKTALIVVDSETDFVAEGAPLRAKMASEVVPPLKRALAHARNTGMRVIFTTHAHRRDGSDMGVLAHQCRRSRSAWPSSTAKLASRFTTS